jgi:membrane fusion protein
MPAGPLFRAEVVEARKQRVYGEILLSHPVRTQLLVLLLCCVTALLATWVALGSYARTELAPGILLTDAPSVKVIAIRPGVVTSLLVREGDIVGPGQKLATIRLEEGNEAGSRGLGESLDAIRLQKDLAAEQVRLAAERATSDQSRNAATQAGLRQQGADLTAQINLQQQAVASAQDMFDRIGGVVEKGFVSRVEFERRRQALISAREDLARLKQQLNAVHAEEATASADLAKSAVESATATVDARFSAGNLTQRKVELENARAYSIEAPIAGRITAVLAAPGRTVDPSIPLMVIVPENSPLHAEIYAPTRAIGFVKPAQEVRLLYDAFPYQRFGSFKGRVVAISRTVLDPKQVGEPVKIEEPVYRIEVRPDAQTIAAFGERTPLQPGMTLTANLVLDRRSFLDWLLEPLNAVMKRNG